MHPADVEHFGAFGQKALQDDQHFAARRAFFQRTLPLSRLSVRISICWVCMTNGCSFLGI